MAEHDITKRLTKLIKNADKLAQDVEKDVRGVISALAELGMSKGGKGDDEPDK